MIYIPWLSRWISWDLIGYIHAIALDFMDCNNLNLPHIALAISWASTLAPVSFIMDKITQSLQHSLLYPMYSTVQVVIP